MKPEPITAFGLFVLRVFRQPAKLKPPALPLPLSATTDEMAELRRALLRQIERDEACHG